MEIGTKVEDYTLKPKQQSVNGAVDLLMRARFMGTGGRQVLMQALSLDNCITFFRLASRYKIEFLQAASEDMICRNFKVVSKTCADLLNLSVEELSQILFSDFVIATEEEIFEAIVLWICADLLGRRDVFSKILPAVRISRCSLRFLNRILHHCLLQDEHIFQFLAEERIRWLISVGLRQDRFAMKNMPRAGYRDMLFVMGGYKNADTVETLDPVVGCWVSHKIPDAPRNSTWIGNVGHRILVLERDNCKFRSFDVVTREWTLLRYPPRNRCWSSVAASGDYVYVLGGKHPHGNSCDRYDASTDLWKTMVPMLEGRIFEASVCHEGKVYCSGGRCVPGRYVLFSMEVLDPRGQWSPLNPMRVGRRNHCLVSCGRFLWAIGGSVEETPLYLSAVERYDVEERQWSNVQPLNCPRSAFSASVIGGSIIAIGGGESRRRSDSIEIPEPGQTVEVYDEEMDQWVLAPSMHYARLLNGSCVVRSLSDADADQYLEPIE